MKWGTTEIDVVNDGMFKLDGGAMFGVVPKVIWNRMDKLIHGMGLFFTDIGPKYEELLEHYVLRHYDFKYLPKY